MVTTLRIADRVWVVQQALNYAALHALPRPVLIGALRFL